jgi:MazG family protein
MGSDSRQPAVERLLEVMRRLRDPAGGCPWDREQDFASIAPYTIEEAYEVAEAIASGAPSAIRDELGDLLFQVVFHARMAEERGWFRFEDVAAGIATKLERRHPHVFGPLEQRDAASQSVAWEAQKADERAAAGQHGALAGVALALPALQRAAKLGKRAARLGFDWDRAAAVRDKVIEELGELDAALQAGTGPTATGTDAATEELGDLLFALANWSRHLCIDPEEALRRANRKFERRFERMEQLAASRGSSLAGLDAAAWDALWNEAKLTATGDSPTDGAPPSPG